MHTYVKRAIAIGTVIALASCSAGCAGYKEFSQGYSRTYSVGYTDGSGRTLQTQATFTPLPKGYGK